MSKSIEASEEAAARSPGQPSRRDFMTVTVTGTVASGIAVAGGLAVTDNPGATATAVDNSDPYRVVYRETPHIRDFYARCRF